MYNLFIHVLGFHIVYARVLRSFGGRFTNLRIKVCLETLASGNISFRPYYLSLLLMLPFHGSVAILRLSVSANSHSHDRCLK